VQEVTGSACFLAFEPRRGLPGFLSHKFGQNGKEVPRRIGDGSSRAAKWSPTEFHGMRDLGIDGWMDLAYRARTLYDARRTTHDARSQSPSCYVFQTYHVYIWSFDSFSAPRPEHGFRHVCITLVCVHSDMEQIHYSLLMYKTPLLCCIELSNTTWNHSFLLPPRLLASQ
jgi:hypothetical protein